MSSSGPGFAVLYRWRIHADAEESFVRAWSVNSALYLSEHGSLGSRLHRGDDGLWYSYAQWPSAQARERTFARGAVDEEASRQMHEAIAESLPEIVLESVSDFMVLPGRRGVLKAARSTRTIREFVGLLAGRTEKVATVEEINEAAARGWAGKK